jgi:hypothetical protein
LAVVRHDADIEIGSDRPGLDGTSDVGLPGGGWLLGVEGGE